jgi:lipopolysaccharide export system permease protein
LYLPLNKAVGMLITRYILREVTITFLVISTILTFLYAGYSVSMILADLADGYLLNGLVLPLVFLSTTRVLDLLLSTALYFSVILVFGRLYRDSEMIVLIGLGYSELRSLRAVLYLAISVALIVGLLSFVARPWAYHVSYTLESRAMDELDIEKLQPGVLEELTHGNYLLFARGVDSANDQLRNVILRSEYGPGKIRLIVAETLHFPEVGESTLNPAEFENGQLYLLDHSGQKDSILEFKDLRLYLRGNRTVMRYKRKAEYTSKLLESTNPKDIAELQWRLSSPITTVLLSLLAFPLARVKPRQRRSYGVLMAILLYAVFFNLMGMARTWVEQGRVAAIPGMWWVHMLGLMIFLGIFLQYRRTNQRVCR